MLIGFITLIYIGLSTKDETSEMIVHIDSAYSKKSYQFLRHCRLWSVGTTISLSNSLLLFCIPYKDIQNKQKFSICFFVRDVGICIFSGFRLIRNKGKVRRDIITLDKVWSRFINNYLLFIEYNKTKVYNSFYFKSSHCK